MGGHNEPPKVPDWRVYRVEDVPELMKLQKALAQHGLKDPWLRNEVWKYTEVKHKWSTGKYFKFVLQKGLKIGVAAGVVTAAIEYAFFPFRNPYQHSSGHH